MPALVALLLLVVPSEAIGAAKRTEDRRPVARLAVLEDPEIVREADRILSRRRGRAELLRAARVLDGELSVVARELRAAGVPRELAALAIVESRLRNVAEKTRRKGRAAGIFMLGPSTARAYGLRVGEPAADGGTIDERFDPHRSSRASARILRDLHRRWKDWRLVLVAWNRGEGKLRRAVAKGGSRDWDVLHGKGLTGRFPVKVLGTALALERLRSENPAP